MKRILESALTPALILAFLCACSSPREMGPVETLPAPPDTGNTPTAQKPAFWKFDGFTIGDPFEGVFAREPYNNPCDIDPVDNRSRSFVVYGANPCRGRVFPNQTTLFFFLEYEKDLPLSGKIQAFGFLHGNWFDSRTDFPVKPRDARANATQKLGTPLNTFRIRSKEHELVVQRHRPVTALHDIHVLIAKNQVYGLVFGTMPEDPENEQWRGIMQMAVRYTPSFRVAYIVSPDF